jgi:8-oxo-dGTP diphosphatase
MAPMRRFGETWRADAPYRQRPGAYAAIVRGPMMLLAATTNAGETYLLPGGGVDPGESPMQALHREVMEEVGWTVAPIRRLGAFQRYCYMPDYGFWARKICMIHLCRAGRRIQAPIEPDHAPVWIPIADAADALSISGERHFVRALLRGRR